MPSTTPVRSPAMAPSAARPTPSCLLRSKNHCHFVCSVFSFAQLDVRRLRVDGDDMEIKKAGATLQKLMVGSRWLIETRGNKASRKPRIQQRSSRMVHGQCSHRTAI